MLARHSKPIETSSPFDVVSRLWHAMQRSDVWNCIADLFRPPSAAKAEAASRRRFESAGFIITNPPGACRQTSPKGRRTSVVSGGRLYWSPGFARPDSLEYAAGG